MGCATYPSQAHFFICPWLHRLSELGSGLGAMSQRPHCVPLSQLRNSPGHVCRGFWARKRAGGQSGFLPGAPLSTRLSEGRAPVSPRNPGCDIK